MMVAPANAEYREMLRGLAALDDVAFAEYMLDLILPDHIVEMLRFHDRHRRSLTLMPRGHAKTTGSILRQARLVGATQGLVPIGVMTEEDSAAESRSRAVQTLVTNPRFAEVFPWAKAGIMGAKWTLSEWTIAGAEQALGKDASFRSESLWGIKPGARFKILLLDDLIGPDSVTTDGMREKVLDRWWNVIEPMVLPDGEIHFLGTRWHESDLYADLIRKGFSTMTRKAIQDDGTALWPSEWPIERLHQKRLDMGAARFDLQYQNDPSGMGGNIFMRKWFRYVDQLPERVVRRAGIDLASSKSERSDYTAMGEVCEDEDHNLYVVGSYADRLEEGHRAWLTGMRDGAFVSVGEESPRLLWPGRLLPPGFAGHSGAEVPRQLVALNIEAVAHQSTFVREVLSATRLPAMPVYPDKDKVTRARALAARYEAGKVFHLRGAPGLAAYEHEAVAFPNGEHDDRVDAMVYAADLGGSEFYFTAGRRV